MTKYSYIKRVLSLFVITVVSVIVMLNVFASKVIKYEIETIGTKKAESDVTVGSVITSFYPLSITIHEIGIKPYNEVNPLKKLDVKRLTLSINASSLTTDKIIINYVKVTDPEITYDAGKLGIKDLSKKALKEAAIGAAGQALLGPIGLGIGIAKTGVNTVKSIKEKSDEKKEKEEQQKQVEEDAKSQKQFLISKLVITGSKFIPAGDVLWAGEGKKINIPDIELENLDNTSGQMITDHVKQVVTTAVKARLNVLKMKSQDEK